MSVNVGRIHTALLATYKELYDLDPTLSVDSDPLVDEILKYEESLLKALYLKGHVLVQRGVGKHE